MKFIYWPPQHFGKVLFLAMLTAQNQQLRAEMVAHHWRRYWNACRRQNSKAARYHLKLATSIRLYTMNDLPPELRAVFANYGRQGGTAKGQSKRRGDAAYYRELARKAVAARKKKQKKG